MRHPLRRAISTYYFNRDVSKRWADYPERMPLKLLRRMLEDDPVAASISGGIPSRCARRCCR